MHRERIKGWWGQVSAGEVPTGIQEKTPMSTARDWNHLQREVVDSSVLGSFRARLARVLGQLISTPHHPERLEQVSPGGPFPAGILGFSV